ncbi:winged helix-turn-helix transcriptional regulator [Sinomicrobium weinanense]|uniref:Helix-turn-helix transcriptional regulator n=1 Tax=Sinomicrobium weinanense TaxID=2842200 RepID=A0A926JWH6_9FLAO|nr:helix-turn-helix domain-containing protein [Sinomicrobium weinanense]MBC9798649.1 helix-turn-helix transcriptional regulator [Sinomicrobium weinanense]MBU3122365.1 helix-turn-helix transcriptional regulator [Sinomicrobium weinanense]
MYVYENKIPQDLGDGVTVAMKVIGGKWKPCIIDCITKGINRPSCIHQAIGQAPRRVINQQLKELYEYEVLSKKMYPGYPLKVEYELTEFGKTVLPLIQAMQSWGEVHAQKVAEIAIRRNENVLAEEYREH